MRRVAVAVFAGCLAAPAFAGAPNVPYLVLDLGLQVKNAAPATLKAAGLTRKGAKALEVVEVMMSNPAAEAGVLVGDLIVKVDGKAVKSAGDLDRKVKALKVGKALTLDLLRGGQTVTAKFSVRLAGESNAPVAPPSASPPASSTLP